MGEAKRAASKSGDLPFHALSQIFPPMTEEEFAGLKADIAEHGLLEMIVTLDGAILDGRNRYRACVELGVEPQCIEWSGVGSPQAFVISHNLHRRHLNESQRGMVAARLATRTKAEAAQIATKHRMHEAVHNVYGKTDTFVPTVEEAARLMNINKDTVINAKRVLNEGTQEEIAAVDRGDVAVKGIAQRIRDNVPPEERKSARETVSTRRSETMRANGQLWGAFRDAINNLAGLPSPEDMLRIVRGNDKAKITGTKLPIALKWLEEFNDVWNRS